MRHFPIFLDTAGKRVVVSGGGEAALAKLRLLMKTQARILVFARDVEPEIEAWAAEGRLSLTRRPLAPGDTIGAALFYAANDDDSEDARVTKLAQQTSGVLTNWVDNLAESRFITPAIVDRDPVTVAIGTEGAAPVLARSIKRHLEGHLPVQLGPLARIGKAFRSAAEALPFGRKRREFWAEYYGSAGPAAFAKGGEDGAQDALEALLQDHLAAKPKQGRVALTGAGPGDPELLTMKARRALDEADVVIYDRLVTPEILELARREAVLIEAGKEGFGVGMAQDEICALMVAHAQAGAHVVRLKGGDPSVFARLDEEAEALEAAGIAWHIIPGITAASAAAASLGQSLTQRGRNSNLRLITGHDTKGFAEQDWRALAEPGQVAAIYMGQRAARFLQGRLLMHGAAPETPVSVLSRVSRPDQRILASSLGRLADDLEQAEFAGPAILMLGLAPRAAAMHAPDLMGLASEAS